MPKAYNLNRYQKEVTMMSTAGEFKPVVRIICKQTHVFNKPYAICNHQKSILESTMRWPKDTYFSIDEVGN